MSLATTIGVGLLGATGAVLRFLVGAGIVARFGARHIYGTLVVNLTGTFAAGLIAGAIEAESPTRLLITGLLGGYTTFSTWVFETHRLTEAGERRLAAANIGVSLALGLLCAWAGLRLGDRLWG